MLSKNMNNNLLNLIGNTPLIKLNQASKKTRCEIYGKAEFLNPCGSVKDRPASFIIKSAIEKKRALMSKQETKGKSPAKIKMSWG